MEAVLKNLASTLEVLAVSHTDFVGEWDAQTVDRAFQWARYCEHVHGRFHSNPSIRPLLEDCMRQTNERLSGAIAGHRALSLAEVAQCRHRLFIGLLRNPATPHSVIKSLVEKFRLLGDDVGAEQCDDTDSDLAALIGCKSACKMLGSLSLDPAEPSLEIGTHVQGLMLLQQIHAIQRRPGNDSYTRTMLDTVLQDSGGLDRLSEVITASLLMDDSTGEDTAAQGFLLDWLQAQHGLQHNMCQLLPAQVCTRLSEQWPKFRLLYWDVLKKWASSLEYDVSQGVWVQQCDSGMSFKMIVDRFKSLWDSGSLLKEETEKELAALKQVDGDFSVQGLSVWTDLLTELQLM